jgi:hypothetical protein
VSARREFKRDVRVEILKRATVNGTPTCEAIDKETGVRCACTKSLALHHIDMDAWQVDKTRKLTVDDGRMLCKADHDPITKGQRKDLARVQAAEARHLGDKDPRTVKIAQPPKAPKPTGKLDSIRALGGSGLSRQGFRSIGGIANDVLRKIAPKRDAAE